MAAIAKLSAARELFEALHGEHGWSIVEGWLRDGGEQETHHLEFKRKHDATTSTVEPDDRDDVAKALSGFANVGGGLLVVGVDAGGGGKKGQAFDRVQRIEPIPKVEVFAATLERSIRTFTDPPIGGLRVGIVPDRVDPTRGIVAILVPQSDGGPHRVVGAGTDVNDRYFMRTAAGQQTMPHALLGAMFARGAPPRLELRARFHSFQPAPQGETRVELRLVNRGRGTARRPTIVLDVNEIDWSDYPARGNPYEGRFATSEAGPNRIVFEPVKQGDFALYPEDEVVVSIGKVSPRGRSDTSGAIHLHFNATLYAIDAQPVRGAATLDMAGDEAQAKALERRAIIPPPDPEE